MMLLSKWFSHRYTYIALTSPKTLQVFYSSLQRICLTPPAAWSHYSINSDPNIFLEMASWMFLLMTLLLLITWSVSRTTTAGWPNCPTLLWTPMGQHSLETAFPSWRWPFPKFMHTISSAVVTAALRATVAIVRRPCHQSSWSTRNRDILVICRDCTFLPPLTAYLTLESSKWNWNLITLPVTRFSLPSPSNLAAPRLS